MSAVRSSVLIVDDEDLVRTLTCLMIERLGHQAVPARNGQQAIQLLKNHVFDLAIVDSCMPGIGGDEVRRFIKQHRPSMKVITASAMPSDEARMDAEEGRHICIEKPFRMQQLQVAIDDLLSGDYTPQNVSS